jgi:hypothetical protein
MKPETNPFAPGAGNRPPQLAGRDELLNRAEIIIRRIKAGHVERSLLLAGLRGVGKTVLLVEIMRRARAAGCHATLVEVQEAVPLRQLLLPGLRKVLLDLDAGKALGDKARRGLRVLKSFLSGLKFTVGGVDIAIEGPAENGVADSGLLDADLADMFVAIGEAAREANTAAVLILDELQYLPEPELGALIMAVHKISQEQLPLLVLGAGLPQLAGNAGRAKSYAERLFLFQTVGALSESDTADALQQPARLGGAEFSAAAIAEIFAQTRGYPYFLQEWGYQTWNTASSPKISLDDVRVAGACSIASLDESFFRVRFDRLTPREQFYLRAMAEISGELQHTGDIAALLGSTSTNMAPLRASLIAKGMIFSPRYGETAFTVPLFNEFMKRAMPELPAKTARRKKK